MHYAEVIGDPVAQSKSPLIHKYWLAQLKLAGDYRRTHVPRGTLADYFADRRADPEWRGCNITIPHKGEAATMADRLDARALAVGAVNCIAPGSDGLTGTNTDVDGIAAALDGTALEGARVVIIGGGGAARAAVAYLASRRDVEVVVLVRDPMKAEPLRTIAPETSVEIGHVGAAGTLLEGAAAIINASPMGMTGSPAIPDDLLAAITRHAGGATLFDMVYAPLETRFLSTGSAVGARVVDGLTMLVGQAARAFELFFGASAPAPDEGLRALLTTDTRDSA